MNYKNDQLFQTLNSIYAINENDVDNCSVVNDEGELIVNETHLIVFKTLRIIDTFNRLWEACGNLNMDMEKLYFLNVFLEWVIEKDSELGMTELELMEKTSLNAVAFILKDKFDSLIETLNDD